MNSDRPEKEVEQPLLTLRQEALLLMLVAFGAISGSIGVAVVPEQYPLPNWTPTALTILFIVEFLIFAAKGGVPRL